MHLFFIQFAILTNISFFEESVGSFFRPLSKFYRYQGPKQNIAGQNKWQNIAGIRDHMMKFGWDQGPNGKNSLGPGTIDKWRMKVRKFFSIISITQGRGDGGVYVWVLHPLDGQNLSRQKCQKIGFNTANFTGYFYFFAKNSHSFRPISKCSRKMSLWPQSRHAPAIIYRRLNEIFTSHSETYIISIIWNTLSTDAWKKYSHLTAKHISCVEIVKRLLSVHILSLRSSSVQFYPINRKLKKFKQICINY